MEEDLRLETLLRCLGQEIYYATDKLSQNTQKALLSLDKNHNSHIFSEKLADILSKLSNYSSQFASNLKDIITGANLCSEFSDVLAKLEQNNVDKPPQVNLNATNNTEGERNKTDFDQETIVNEKSTSSHLDVIAENIFETSTIDGDGDGDKDTSRSILDNLNAINIDEERNKTEFDRETVLNESSNLRPPVAVDEDIFETSTVCADGEENTSRSVVNLNASKISDKEPNKNHSRLSNPDDMDQNEDISHKTRDLLPDEEPDKTDSSQETIVNAGSTSPRAVDENIFETNTDKDGISSKKLNTASIDEELANIDSDQETIYNENLISKHPSVANRFENNSKSSSDSTLIDSEEMFALHLSESDMQGNDNEPAMQNKEDMKLIASQEFNCAIHEIPVSKEKAEFLKALNLRQKKRREKTDIPGSSQEESNPTEESKERKRLLNLISRYYLRKRNEVKKKYSEVSDSEADDNDKLNTKTNNEQVSDCIVNTEIPEEKVNNNNIDNSEASNKRRLSCDNENNCEPLNKKPKLNTISSNIATLSKDHSEMYKENEVKYNLSKDDRDELLDLLNACLKNNKVVNEQDVLDEKPERLSQTDLLALMEEFNQSVQKSEESVVLDVAREEPVGAEENKEVIEKLGDLLSDNDDDTVTTISSISCFDDNTTDGELEEAYQKVMQRQKTRKLWDQQLVEHNMTAKLYIKLERLDISQYLDKSSSSDTDDTDKLCDLSTLERKRTARPSRPSRRRTVSSSSSSTSSSIDTNSSHDEDLLFNNLNIDSQDHPDHVYDKQDCDDWASAMLDQIVDSSDEASLSSYNSDSSVKRTKVKRRRMTKKKSDCDSDATENSGDEIDSESPIVFRKSVKQLESDSDLASLSDSSDQESCKDRAVTPDNVIVIDDNEDSPVKLVNKGRRNIRALVDDANLAEETQKANNEEAERIKRLEETSKQRDSFTRSESFMSQLSADDQDALILDVYNEQRVIVHPKIARKLKRHQREGIQFMWDSCYESIKQIEQGWTGSGCILAHCMGLGKTLQALALIHALFRSPLTKTKHVLVVCPLSTVSNWKNEHRLAYGDIFDSLVRLHILESKRTGSDRFQIVNKWWRTGGLLVMGYECFGTLTKEDKLEKWQQQNLCSKENILEALVDPGPDLVICDEGHLLRNKQSQRAVALNKVKTRRRIVLTGTPLQNNLIEYYYMVNFVKPSLLGTLPEYTTNFVNPINNGQFEDSTAEDIMLMKKRTHVLHKILNKAVQRFEDTELKKYLPKLIDQAVFVKLSKTQVDLYNRYLDLVDANRPTAYTKEGKVSHKSFLGDVQQLRYICAHPEVLVRAGRVSSKIKEHDVIEDQLELEGIDEKTGLQKDWYKDLLPSRDNDTPQLDMGTKLLVAIRIIEESAAIGDKTLIFVQTYAEMDTLELFLGKCLQYKKNRDYVRMDGTISPEVRSQMCDRFNRPDETNLKAFIMSSKVGGLGLNITAANRVIILSVSWNPSIDTQSVFRTFRFGQTKTVYVYRLVTQETAEEKIYQRVITKLAVAHRVVDKHQITRHYTAADIQAFYSARPSYNWERPVPSVPEDHILAHLIQQNKCISRWHEHQTLLKNRPEEDLNEQQKNSAWEEYNRKEFPPSLPPITQTAPGDISVPSTIQNALSHNVSPYLPAYQTFNRQNLMRRLNDMQAALSDPNSNPNQNNMQGGIWQAKKPRYTPNLNKARSRMASNVSNAANWVIHISSDEEDEVVVNEMRDPLALPISSRSDQHSGGQSLPEE